MVSVHGDRRLHRVSVLRLYRRPNHRSSLAFLGELTAAFPFQIRKIQVDNGTEFPPLFALSCQDLGVRARYIRPRRPEQNGKFERSQRIDEEEFWGRYAGGTSTPRVRCLLPGSTATTTNAFRWHYVAARRWRNSPRFSRRRSWQRRLQSLFSERARPPQSTRRARTANG